MSNLATVTHLRPSQRPVERRVAEVEDGYTRLANALYEELIGADLTKNQSKVAHAICRKTYGYGKKMDRISDSQLAQITRLPRQKVNKAKNELIAMKVILREGQQIIPPSTSMLLRIILLRLATNLFMPFLTVNLFLDLYILNEINLIVYLTI